jgi:hypothetical protein
MAAKYYIYRNLNRGGFSVKYKGLVVDYLDTFEANDAEFRVSEAGRNRAREQKARNVHAYLVCEKYKKRDSVNTEKLQPVYYNPFLTETFVLDDTDIPVSGYVHSAVFGKNGKVYVEA